MNSRYRGTWDSLHGQGTRAEIHVRVLLWPAALALALDLDHKGAGRSDYDATVPWTAHALARNGIVSSIDGSSRAWRRARIFSRISSLTDAK